MSKEATKKKAAAALLYSNFKFQEAISIYKKCQQCQPRDAVFPSNISACFYERGLYVESSKYACESINVLATLLIPFREDSAKLCYVRAMKSDKLVAKNVIRIMKCVINDSTIIIESYTCKLIRLMASDEYGEFNKYEYDESADDQLTEALRHLTEYEATNIDKDSKYRCLTRINRSIPMYRSAHLPGTEYCKSFFPVLFSFFLSLCSLLSSS